MVSAETARNIVGIVGNVISFGLFLSPVPTFYRIIKKKTVEEFKPYPYIMTVVNCLMWIIYGLPMVHPDSLLVITINSIGLALELIYLAIFFTYAKNQKNGRKKVAFGLLIEAVFTGVVLFITLVVLHGYKNRSMLVGVLCDIFNILMYFSPLTVMRMVIATKSVKYMPFFLSLATLLNSVIWTAYALIKFDPYMLTSNGLGSLSGVAQLVLYAYYYRSTPKDGDNDGDGGKQAEVQMAHQNA